MNPIEYLEGLHNNQITVKRLYDKFNYTNNEVLFFLYNFMTECYNMSLEVTAEKEYYGSICLKINKDKGSVWLLIQDNGCLSIVNYSDESTVEYAEEHTITTIDVQTLVSKLL